MKRRLFFIFLAILLLGTILYFYINKIFLPIQAKQFFISKSEEFLHRKFAMGKINLKLLKGITIRDVVIYEKDSADKPFLQIDELTLNIIIPAFLKNKSIVISSIRIKNPYIHLVRLKDNEWNFSDMIPQKGETSDTKRPFSLLVRKIFLESGQIDFTDQSQEQKFEESFKDINLNVILSFSKNVIAKLDAVIPEKKSSLKVDGHYNITTKTFSADLALKNITFAQYLKLALPNSSFRFNDGFLTTANLNVGWRKDDFLIKGDAATTNIDLTLKENQRISGDIQANKMDMHWKDHHLTLKGNISSPNISLQLSDNKTLKGDLNGQIRSLSLAEADFNFDGDLKINNGNFQLDPTKNLQGNVTASGLLLAKQPDNLQIQGDFVIDKANFAFNPNQLLQGNVTLDKTLFNLSNGKMTAQSNLTIADAVLQLSQERILKGQISTTDLALSSIENMLKIKSKIQINDADIAIDKKKNFKGSPSIDVACELNLSNPSEIKYSGSANLANATLTGLPKVNTLEDISGEILFESNLIKTDLLTLVADGTGVRLSGSVTNFAKPVLNIKLSSDNVDLAKASSFYPDLLNKFQTTINGAASIKLDYKGALDTPLAADVKLIAQIRKTTIHNDKLPGDITNLNGLLDYSKNLFIWRNLKGTFLDDQYAFNGKLTNFARPTILTSLTSKKINLSTQINVLENAFQITSLTGKYFDSSFDIKGDAHLNKESEPDLDLKWKLDANLENLPNIAPSLQEKLSKVDAKGILTAEGTYKGRMKDWRNWQLNFKAYSPKISLMNYPIKNLNLQFNQKNKRVNQCDLTAALYSGNINLTSSANLAEDNVPLTVIATLENLDLAELKEDKQLKIERLAGKVSSSLNLNGPALDLTQLKGNATLVISEGYLWQWNILEGLFSALLIPEFKNIVFTDAQADFLIDNKKFYTENAQLMSQTVSLRAKGSIDFDMNLDLNVNPQFSEIAILKSDSLKKGPTNLITQAFDIRITGTLDKPKYKVSTSPFKVIGNTTDLLKDGVKGILQEIF